ncbi:MAG: Clp protease N-terminal domain-containing protein, partial [Actinobacteria bacterium]|nr:Clp protease N-terminal domain-containing protein [Actinomycetota bacterium]
TELGVSPVATAGTIGAGQVRIGPAQVGHLPFTPEAKRAVTAAVRASLGLKDDHVGTEHLVLGLIDVGGSIGWKVLHDAGIDGATYRARVLARTGRVDDGSHHADVQLGEHAYRLLWQGQGAEALEWADRALADAEQRGDPTATARLQNLVAWAVAIQLIDGRYAEALSLAEAAVAADPDSLLYRGTRAAVLAVVGRGPEVIDVLEHVVTLGDDALGNDRGTFHALCARAHVDAGDVERARHHAERSDELPHPWPVHGDAWRRIDERSRTWEPPPNPAGSAF